MKKIDRKEPAFYGDYIISKKPESWDELSKDIGYDVRVYMLMKEQNYQCAYTEIYIEPEDSHIDHFKKQSFLRKKLFSITIFEWNNLLTSCNSEFYGARFKDKNITCNDYKELIDPVSDDPQKYFDYSITGEILVGENDAKANNTLRLFNLNDYSLVQQRQAVAIQVKSMYKQFSVDEIVKYIGKFESFIRAVYFNFVNIEDN